MKKLLILIYLLFGAFFIWYGLHLQNQSQQIERDIEKSKQESFSGNTFEDFTGSQEKDIYTQTGKTITGSILTGSTLTGSTQTGIIIPSPEKTDMQKFLEWKEKEVSRSFRLPDQPRATGTYEEKSAILNDFISKNTSHFTLPVKISEGYLYIKTIRELKENEDIFVYFYNTNLNGYPVSGKFKLNESLVKTSDGEYLFKLEDLPIYKYFDKSLFQYNWLENELQQTKKVHFIAGYVTTSYGNSIQEIVIAGK